MLIVSFLQCRTPRPAGAGVGRPYSLRSQLKQRPRHFKAPERGFSSLVMACKVRVRLYLAGLGPTCGAHVAALQNNDRACPNAISTFDVSDFIIHARPCVYTRPHACERHHTRRQLNSSSLSPSPEKRKVPLLWRGCPLILKP